MTNQKFMLWSEDEMLNKSGTGTGTFSSCNPSITYYPSNNKDDRGCIIVIPGGGYEDKSMENEGTDIVKMLNQNGLDAFVLDYRVTPDYHPAPLNDAHRAIEIVKSLSSELGYKEDKVGVMGFSAGGHLAASAGTMWTSQAARPDALVLCYPVITMGKHSNIRSKSNLFGGNISNALSEDMSCEYRVDKKTPPTFIWHTADDNVVPVENSLLFASALSTKGVSFQMHIYPHGEHGLGLAKNNPKVSIWSELCIEWLKEEGF